MSVTLRDLPLLSLLNVLVCSQIMDVFSLINLCCLCNCILCHHVYGKELYYFDNYYGQTLEVNEDLTDQNQDGLTW